MFTSIFLLTLHSVLDVKYKSNNMSKVLRPITIGKLMALPFAMSTVLVGNGQTVLAKAPKVEHVTNEAAVKVIKINSTTVELVFSDNRRVAVDFYGDNIFRIFEDHNDGVMRDPVAKPEAHILVDNPRKSLSKLDIQDKDGKITLSTGKAEVVFDKKTGLFSILDATTGKVVTSEVAPVSFGTEKVSLSLCEQPGEYYYGGGVQNGRFSHKGEKIEIVNTNNWVDGGVASPAPFYWSTAGYGFMWYTFKPGYYDFGADKKGTVKLTHESNNLDVFFMVGEKPVDLLGAYYQLTGYPVLLPKFGFYEGHLNAYNRDYWKESSKGRTMLFEDGKTYVESSSDKTGIKESLNGEKNNYQFSARAAIDRYVKNDMPLGWFLPNDGYGAGYGQESTLDGNIRNLREFGDYARKHGVEIGLWTQSDLHPKDSVEALLQRDIVKEVGDAGVRVLKTDVAWVGDGYSFGLNGVSDVAQIMPYYGDNARPFIISLDGWAGTQRYASIWSGDQTGGDWEYIRFHIPTFIGAGLSGLSNITSDLDGIFGGKNVVVNMREFEWKTFTAMGLNMDGWGSNPKYPFSLGEPATSVNRWYLKLKSELMPYIYSEAHEAVTGKPLMRAMFLDDPNPYTLGKATQYQFLCGPYFLVAPIYKETKADKEGNDIRNGIYLPEGEWVDFFGGKVYKGGRIINEFDAPFWKLPVLVKRGAIIPMANPNNNVSQIDATNRIFELYPYGESGYNLYDDDGKTELYRSGESVNTHIHSSLNKERLIVTIDKTVGDYTGFEKNKSTELRINVDKAPKRLVAKVGGKSVKLMEVKTFAEFQNGENVWFYDKAPQLNRFATKGSEFEKKDIRKNPIVYVRIEKNDVKTNGVEVRMDGYSFDSSDALLKSVGTLNAPQARLVEAPGQNKAFTLSVAWDKQANVDYYEIKVGDLLYSTIRSTQFTVEDLKPETDYALQVRAVNKDGASEWTMLNAHTVKDPLDEAIRNITAKNSTPDWDGLEISKMFDFNENNYWHTDYYKKDVLPFDLTLNLHGITKLDKIQYIPSQDRNGKGQILKGCVAVSMDGITWTPNGNFEWKDGEKTQTYLFKDAPEAQYVKMTVEETKEGQGSGTEMYVFKVPGSRVQKPGDINNDNKVDDNDFTSYMNYCGLRKGDKDFEGYVSNGDINRNGLIDAYDISVVATQLKSGVGSKDIPSVGGNVTIVADKKQYATGDEVTLTVKGKDLVSLNALSFALPYNPGELEYQGVTPLNMMQMENITRDRLHSDGEKVLYPTFVNIGEQKYVEGTKDLFVIKFKAKKAFRPVFKMGKLMMVDKFLRVKTDRINI